MFKRIILIIMDSVGVGALPDADKYGDQRTNTLGNICLQSPDLYLQNLHRLGIGNIIPLPGHPFLEEPLGLYGKAAELSIGKDTTTGHWELMGIVKNTPWPFYPDGFPPEIIKNFCRKTGRDILCNQPASGTEVIEKLGKEHMQTGNPIIYTSADSVFQIACHEETVPLPLLYKWCQIARNILQGEHGVARVIARPFIGKPGNFQRTSNRKDFSLPPIDTTALDILTEHGHNVTGIGKISDIFCGRGITDSRPSKSNSHGMGLLQETLDNLEEGFIFVNLVDFDMLYGHRNNTKGYARALKEFDNQLADIMLKLQQEDLLLLSADHGCDPTYIQSTDHTREYIPILAWGPQIQGGESLGTRETFADIGKTILHNWNLQNKLKNGTSFYEKFLHG